MTYPKLVKSNNAKDKQKQHSNDADARHTRQSGEHRIDHHTGGRQAGDHARRAKGTKNTKTW